MSCSHMPAWRPPRPSDVVHREECTLCFDSHDSPEGVDVCLECFHGGCPREHAKLHYTKTGHGVVVNVRRVLKPGKERDDAEPPLKRLAIEEVHDEDLYDFHLQARCYACGGVEIPSTPEMQTVIDGIMASNSSSRQSEIKAWEEDLTPCEHTLCLVQEPLSSSPVSSKGSHCSSCELTENLWLCLTCGNLSCGRAQFGGGGGNGHALAHYEATGHGVALKLGTITPEGGGDVYCYACNEERVDGELKEHCGTFGILLAEQVKTEKSMTELQLEHNIKFDFSMTGDDGAELEPLFGPGLTGLKNLGNSCYLASTVQTLFALPAFQSFYPPTSSHPLTCSLPPADCPTCQLLKLSDGLLSGRYSNPTKRNGERWQEGLKPSGFKGLVGRGHEEFASMRQQDAEEFFQHLLKYLRTDYSLHPPSSSSLPLPTDAFRFGLEQRLQCTSCLGVRYRVDSQDSVSVPVEAVKKQDGEGWEAVDLNACLDGLTGEEEVEYECANCEGKVTAVTRTRFATFPEVLVVHAKKFQLVNWVPQKLEVPVMFGDELDLGRWKGTGLVGGEVALPEDEASAGKQLEFNTAALDMLQGMGFPLIRCQRALLATGNQAGEEAMEWLFAHMDDPDIDAPLESTSNAGAGEGGPSAEQVSMLADMGFTPAQARKALRLNNGLPDAAVEWLFSNPTDPGEDATPSTTSAAASPSEGTGASGEPSWGGSADLPAKYRLKAFINHKGPSVHSGHYVATIERDEPGGGAVLFNDEKVAKSSGGAHETLKQAAYLYVFERIRD